MLTVQAEVSGAVHTATLWGRQYRVVPAVLVRNQVLHNNLGNTFLPADAITHEWANAWNFAPVIVGGHPTSRGQPVTARQHAVLESRGVGHLFNVRREVHNGIPQLNGEVWIAEDRAPEVQSLQPIVTNLDAGQPVELSTGFPVLVEDQMGSFQGRQYEVVLHPSGTDHLAISTEFTGACSVVDGCGLGVNEQGEEETDMEIDEVVNVMSAARTPTFSGTESTPWSAPSLATYISALGFHGVSKVGDLSAAQKKQIASHTLLGDAGAGTFAELSFFPVVNPRTHKLNSHALRAVISGRGAQANIPANAKESARSKAKSLLEAHFHSTNYDEEPQLVDEAAPPPAPPQQEQPSTPPNVVLRESDLPKAVDAPSGFWERLFSSLGNFTGKLRMATDQMGESDRQFQQRVGSALSQHEGTDCIISDLFSQDGRVIYWRHGPSGPDPDGDQYYQIGFTESPEGDITFQGAPTLVHRSTVYEPVGAPHGRRGPPIGSGNFITTGEDPDNAEETMNRQEMIAQLSTAGVLEEATLSKLNDCQLTGLFKGAGLGTAEADNSGGGAESAANAEANAQLKTLTEQVTALVSKTEEQAATITALQAAAAPAIAEREATKVRLIKELAENTRVPWSEDELKALGFEELRKLQAMSRGVSYVGLGAPQEQKVENSEPQFMPTTPYFAKSSEQEA